MSVVCCVASSFSTVRKKHTGPRQSKTVAGFASSTQALTTLVAQMRDLTSAREGAKLTATDSLTFTHHFRLRRSPHRGHVMRKRPSGLPPPPHGTRGLSCLPAQRPRRGDSRLYSLLVVGAPLASGLASPPELRVIGMLTVNAGTSSVEGGLTSDTAPNPLEPPYDALRRKHKFLLPRGRK